MRVWNGISSTRPPLSAATVLNFSLSGRLQIQRWAGLENKGLFLCVVPGVQRWGRAREAAANDSHSSAPAPCDVPVSLGKPTVLAADGDLALQALLLGLM